MSSPDRWEKRGLEAVLAQDAVEALRQFRDDPPSLVLLDDRLPGFELSGLVRILHATSKSATIPIILMSHERDAAGAAEAVGADGFIRASDAHGRLPEALGQAVSVGHGRHRHGTAR